MFRVAMCPVMGRWHLSRQGIVFIYEIKITLRFVKESQVSNQSAIMAASSSTFSLVKNNLEVS